MVQLDSELRSEIASEVKKAYLEEDSQLRKVWADEAKNYRDFLESQFRWITIGVSVLASVGVAIFIWFFSDSVNQTNQRIKENLDSARESMTDTIDSKVIEYRIIRELKERVSEMVQVEVGNQAEKVATEIIQPRITDLAAQAVNNIAEKKINEAIAEQIKKVQSFNVEELLQRAAIPLGAVVAFAQTCPTGWKLYSNAGGRVIVGTGAGEGLTARLFLELGGSERHSLTIEELPQQEIEIGGLVGLSGVDRYNAGGKDYPVVGRTSGKVQVGGLGKPFPILPPYIVLNYCERI